MQTPKQAHFDALMHVVCYLKAHPMQGIVLNASNVMQMYAYRDSD